ncbi:sulfatase-like hydrolase/transferase [bacterium]|nr:sulfatase-like hydrolase/transferase [bacterium]
MKSFYLALTLLVCLSAPAIAAETNKRLPNIIMVVTDDMGYGDMSSQGAKGFTTPNLDHLAKQGTRFTNFYVAQPVCTASRAAFLSGCYPNRVSLQGALNHTSKNGINPDEYLLPEMLKDLGYATAGMGKWHLGTVLDFWPTKNGFDEWFGTPYSNDNTKYHPVLSKEMPPFPLYEGETVIELDPDQSLFTKRITGKAISFIERNKDRPFFLYIPQIMPHVPIFASDEFKGRTEHGLYGDVIEELDWSMGQLMRTLDRLKLTDDTILIFFSDNGPWPSYGEHAGDAGPFREGKLTTFEGGVHVPCIMRWPGHIPAGRVCKEPIMSIDLLPTLTHIVGGQMPMKKIDGLDISDVLLKKDGKSPHEALFFYAGTELQAVRSGKWKLHFNHPYITVAGEPGKGGKPSMWGKLPSQSITQSGIEGIASRHGGKVVHIEESLFDLDADPGETKNVAAEHPEVVKRLKKLAEPIRKELGDSLNGVKGTEVREAGWVK